METTLDRPDLTQLISDAEQAGSATDEVLRNSSFASQMATLRGESQPSESGTIRNVFRGLLEQNRAKLNEIAYPDGLKRLHAKEFDRIEQEIADGEDDLFSLSLHRCRSDLRILSFGRLAVGPEHLEIDGFPKGIIAKNGVGQFFSALSLAASAGGFKPFYGIHLAYGHDPATFLFSYGKRAQKRMFLLIAECMEMHPEIKGLLAGSWWHDPAVANIAPHLSFLSKVWTDNGAKLFFWEQSDDITETATRNSPPRKALVEKGEYQPKAYMAVWPRQALLDWAKKQS